MKLQVKNSILAHISDALSRESIQYKIGAFSETELLCEVNHKRFIVDNKMSAAQILLSAQNCLTKLNQL